MPTELSTSRLRLRRWEPEDRPPFAAMNADPVCMEFFPKTLTREESDALADRIEDHWLVHGFGLWVVEIPDVSRFAGFVGVNVPRFEAPFMPAIEIGWRLPVSAWGHGYATEGARAALDFAFTELGLAEIVALTVPENRRSRRVMEKLGMVRNPTDDFDHPLIADGSPLKRHVLYRLPRPD